MTILRKTRVHFEQPVLTKKANGKRAADSEQKYRARHLPSPRMVNLVAPNKLPEAGVSFVTRPPKWCKTWKQPHYTIFLQIVDCKLQNAEKTK